MCHLVCTYEKNSREVGIKNGNKQSRQWKNTFTEYFKSREFLNVGKNVQNTPFDTLTSDNTYVYSDTGKISFSTFVRLLRWDSVDSTSRTQLTVVFTPPKDHFCGVRYSFFI